jgi:hypothetical protein
MKKIKPPREVSSAVVLGGAVVVTVACLAKFISTKLSLVPGTGKRSLGFDSTATITHPAAPTTVATNIPVFYNLFLRPDADEAETERIRALVTDQLSYLIPDVHYPIYVHSIGGELPIAIPNATLLGRHPNGAQEVVTLQSLWEYCRGHPHEAVVYLHSKGSYHATPQNEHLRTLLTLGALSPECAAYVGGVAIAGGNATAAPGPDAGRAMNERTRPTWRDEKGNWQCNHCSSRFSPFPHPHTPGNMWMAKCSYVATLIEPAAFAGRMKTKHFPRLVRYRKARKFPPYVVGQKRFAAEHWVASRGASLQPCDLYPSKKFLWGYRGIPKNLKRGDISSSSSSSPIFDLQPAPRFRYEVWAGRNGRRISPYLSGLAHRWEEYEILYNETPPLPTSPQSSEIRRDNDTWWGWRMKAWADEALTWNGTSPPS